MIHKHISMTDFLRNPSANLPQNNQTVLISRQSNAGPQMFSLSAVNFQNSSLNTNQDVVDLVKSLNKVGDIPVHEHKKG